MRHGWSSRQGPGDLDENPVLEPVLEFDLQKPWPQTYFGSRFGPSFIAKVIKSGLLVFAEIEAIPYPIAIKQARWCGEVLEVVTLEGPRIPTRLFTRTTARGMDSSGLLHEEKLT